MVADSRPLSQASRLSSNQDRRDIWRLAERYLKRYPHFDGAISSEDAVSLATNPERVAKHTFYPFLTYAKRYTRFAPKGIRGKVKERLIRFGARRDAYIFMYYRHILSTYYEAELLRYGLNDVVIAYRKIPDAPLTLGLGQRRRHSHKSTIHFARDAFQKIASMAQNGNVLVFCFDIASFFEKLDHNKIKEDWRRLLKADRLPNDHFRVFEAATRYAYVDLRECLKQLGMTEKVRLTNGKVIDVPKKKLPMRLCTGREFRLKIARVPGSIAINNSGRGVPQGCPISDVIANIYMLDFDRSIAEFVNRSGGYYRRYADDLLIAIPERDGDIERVVRGVETSLEKYCCGLKIKEEKTSIHRFQRVGDLIGFDFVKGEQGKNGLEYLGFRFDGKHVYIRDSTLSAHYRKMTYRVRSAVCRWRRAHPDMARDEFEKRFPKEVVYQRLGKVENWDERKEIYRNWTFYSYAKRCHELMAALQSKIADQLKGHRRHFERRVEREIERAFSRGASRRAEQPTGGAHGPSV